MWSLLSRAALLLPLFQSGDETDKGSRPVSLTGILGPDGDGKYWIHSAASNSDTGQPVLSAAFVPYGASLTNLIFHDRWGIARDIVAGFENASYYSIDKTHAHLNGVPGRYANRIRNSSFVLDGRTVHVRPNENPTAEHPEGVDTLHGGPNGWDWRNFTVIAHDENSISFELVDLDGAEGFPGEVVAFVTYALTGTSTWDIKMVAVSTQQRTPIMLSSHTYWNLDGFGNNETRLALNHSLHMPDARRRVGVDSILVPTGELLANDEDSVNDFWSAPRQLGKGFESPGIKDNCGLGCSGYGSYFVTPDEASCR